MGGTVLVAPAPPARWGGVLAPGRACLVQSGLGGRADAPCGGGEEPVFLGCHGRLSQGKAVTSEDGIHWASGLPDACGQGWALAGVE